MKISDLLKEEMKTAPAGVCSPNYYRYQGLKKDLTAENLKARANGIETLFTLPEPYIYKNDYIVGSIRSLWCDAEINEIHQANAICGSFGRRTFTHNADHFTADYRRIIKTGVPGLLSDIEASEKKHADDPKKMKYLAAMKQTVSAFRTMIVKHGDKALSLIGTEGYDDDRLRRIAHNCYAIADNTPTTFEEGLQLIWFCHLSFIYDDRYAMALGRIDQYVYDLYLSDLEKGTVTKEYAELLYENICTKIYEKRAYFGGDDVVNIAIGGTAPDGTCEVNDLSYAVLEAVGNNNTPGPNLSARLNDNTPDEFIEACLKVIGTGLGYPALMSDKINMAALAKIGYDYEDVCDYTMVGCIENFITGKQPPWSDGRFDTPRYLEYVFTNGRPIISNGMGLRTGDIGEVTSMDELMERYKKQLQNGVAEYVVTFKNENQRFNPENYLQPYLSCFCEDCIGRALDMSQGGAKYPSVHGAAVMGVGTVCDSLAAIEKVVFIDKEATLTEIRDAMLANFEGYDELRAKLLAAPKYGNNDDFVDKYAIWFVDYLASLFNQYRTPDGGAFYIAMAANISNIYSGMGLGASPDGRLAKEPISDASSPTYGRDTRGITSTVNSVTKPDYTNVACGSVVNQKFSPSMFHGEKLKKLRDIVKVYIKKGGQEMQMNATSREVLQDAMEHPEKYANLVVRVSGYSAYYITLAREVQLDILNRTQQG